MSYCALYRRYRPQYFKDVVGQEHIITTLRHQVSSSRIAHAYLFCGTRGTGKTTVAKIFARAVNCLDHQEGEPCGHCSACLANAEDGGTDIIEIDAASNNGINEMRDLREKVRLAPLSCRYKVYILDEAHMITNDAFNALLKTLEEPPPHAIFILATTEPQRLPATILSRCQRYEFHRIGVQGIVGRLRDVLGDVHVSMEEAGMQAIAAAAQGGLRDALSLADQCIGFCGNVISHAQVLNVLGSMDDDFFFDVACALIEGDAAHVLLSTDRVLQLGRDLGVFCSDLLSHFRSLMLLISGGEKMRPLLHCTDESFERYARQAQSCSLNFSMRAVAILSETESEMKWLSAPRLLFESALLRLCLPEPGESVTALTDRIERLEKAIADGAAKAPASPQQNLSPAPSAPSALEAASGHKKNVPEPSQLPNNQAQDIFNAIVERQGEGIRHFFHAGDWHAFLPASDILELLPPPDALPTLVKTLSDRAQELAKSVEDQYPNLTVRFVTQASMPSVVSQTPQPDSLHVQAAALFGADKIEKKP